MKTRWCFWLPFGDLLHGESEPGGPIWRKGSGNPKWWEARARVLAEYTLPSLLNQDLAFEVWAGIPQEAGDMHEPVTDLLEDWGATVVVHPARNSTKYGKGVARKAVLQALSPGYDAVTFLNCDSDDMYLQDAARLASEATPEPGLVQMFRAGYVMHESTGAMHVYAPAMCPPPFFSRCYTPEYADDPDAYEEKWVYRVPHNQLRQSVKRIDLPDGRFVVVSHGRNTSSFWGRLGRAGKLGAEVTGADKDFVLMQCGVQ